MYSRIYLLTATRYRPWTSLGYAVLEGNINVVRLLLASGAAVNCDSGQGLPLCRSPMYFAAERGHKRIAKLLMSHGARADLGESFRMKTPLHFAAESGHPEMVKLLVENGANVNAKYFYEGPYSPITPMGHASRAGHAVSFIFRWGITKGTIYNRPYFTNNAAQ